MILKYMNKYCFNSFHPIIIFPQDEKMMIIWKEFSINQRKTFPRYSCNSTKSLQTYKKILNLMNNEINNIPERNMFHILKQDLKQLTICVLVTAMTSHIQSFVLFYYHYQYTFFSRYFY